VLLLPWTVLAAALAQQATTSTLLVSTGLLTLLTLMVWGGLAQLRAEVVPLNPWRLAPLRWAIGLHGMAAGCFAALALPHTQAVALTALCLSAGLGWALLSFDSRAILALLAGLVLPTVVALLSLGTAQAALLATLLAAWLLLPATSLWRRRPVLRRGRIPLAPLTHRPPLPLSTAEQDALKTYEFVLNNISDIVSVVDEHHTIRAVNDAWCRATGISREAALGQLNNALPGFGVSAARVEALRACLEDGKQRTIRGLFNAPGVMGRVLDTTFHPYVDPITGTRGAVRVSRDVTEHEVALKALLASQAEQRLLLEVFPGFCACLDAQLRYTFVNERLARASGRSPAQWIGRTVAEMVSPEKHAFLLPMVHRALQGELVHYESPLPGLDGGPQIDTLITLARGTDPQTGEPRCYAFGADVSALKQAQAALVLAKEEAERANRAKSQFLSSMSHELRTPMNSVLGFGQLLEADAHALSAQHRLYLREILRGGRHLLALINDLLDLARIENDKLAVSLEPVVVAEVIDECRFLIQPLAERHHVQVIPPTGSAPDHMVLADRTRLRQVLLNLLSNGIKYNHKGGTVQIRWARSGDLLRVEIEDSGPGLSADEQVKLFQAFERLGAQHGTVEGAGIGLALSQRLLALMGGHIGVSSSVGEGCLFWVTLPHTSLSMPTALPQQMHSPDDMALAAAAMDRTVLYIEDNPVNTMLMEAMLARLPGLKVLTAAMPQDGLALARQHKPNLILLDIQLPEMDGFEVFRHLQAADSTRDIPVIAVSASAMTQDIERGRRIGFADYLTKPLDSQQLLHAVMRSLSPH
jgi:PAS domain S-box-containing protein